MQTPNINYQKWLFICIGLVVFGIGVGFIGFPKLLRKMVKGVSNDFWGFILDKFASRPIRTTTHFSIEISFVKTVNKN